MNRFLALSTETRARAFEQAAARRGWPPMSVEKDFWVCALLHELFTLPTHGEHLTFKGGTSLSKAWRLIDRFSEDIDLTISRDALGLGQDLSAASKNERRRQIDGLKKACRHAIHEAIEPALRARIRSLLPDEAWSLVSDPDDPDDQTLLFAYPRGGVAGIDAYVQPVVKLEFGARSDSWPIADRDVGSIVAEEFPMLFDTRTTRVRAVVAERTFWEKVLLLHEERHRPAVRPPRARMARHFYDVYRLIVAGIAENAVVEESLFERVVAHRGVFFAQTWVDYATLTRGMVDIVPHPEQIDAWRADYAAMQGVMFLDTPPSFDEVLTAIAAFQSKYFAR